MSKVIRIFALQLEVSHVVSGDICYVSGGFVCSQAAQLKMVIFKGHQVGAPLVLVHLNNPVRLILHMNVTNDVMHRLQQLAHALFLLACADRIVTHGGIIRAIVVKICHVFRNKFARGLRTSSQN